MLRACKGAQSTQHPYSAGCRPKDILCVPRKAPKSPITETADTDQLPGLVQIKHLMISILLLQIEILRIRLFHSWKTKTPESSSKSSLAPPNTV